MAQSLPAWITASVAVLGVAGALWKAFTAISLSLVTMTAEIKRLSDKIDSHQALIAKDLEDEDRRLKLLEEWQREVLHESNMGNKRGVRHEQA